MCVLLEDGGVHSRKNMQTSYRKNPASRQPLTFAWPLYDLMCTTHVLAHVFAGRWKNWPWTLSPLSHKKHLQTWYVQFHSFNVATANFSIDSMMLVNLKSMWTDTGQLWPRQCIRVNSVDGSIISSYSISFLFMKSLQFYAGDICTAQHLDIKQPSLSCKLHTIQNKHSAAFLS